MLELVHEAGILDQRREERDLRVSMGIEYAPDETSAQHIAGAASVRNRDEDHGTARGGAARGGSNGYGHRSID